MMENCVDLVNYNSAKLVIIKQPGSVRHPNGDAIEKVMMTLSEAKELENQLTKLLNSIG